MCKKGISDLKQAITKKERKKETKANESHRQVLHVPIRLCTEFELNLTILIFGPNLPKKSISHLKQIKTKPSLKLVFTN